MVQNVKKVKFHKACYTDSAMGMTMFEDGGLGHVFVSTTVGYESTFDGEIVATPRPRGVANRPGC